ncbi:outer membrane protein [Bacteroides reticulotermitis JCM 10512]|uniref:Outer membrane protein n=1 Tax=Bacteroides reticulotermitis JCM 10512 TaxID=1445607 RepID=W4UQL8_9BACE|nr:outer membrane protein [Bacteroides reticulotermitis JCM 10512]
MNSNILNLRHLAVFLMLCTTLIGTTVSAFAQQQAGGKQITGQVIDENKEPMIGVSILIVGTSQGTVTDFDGNYTLVVPKANKTLQFSYVGYVTQTVAMPTSGNVLNIQMKSDSQLLSDVVVIGYGTQRKSDLTGSVTNVSSKDFNMAGKFARATNQRKDIRRTDYVQQWFAYCGQHDPHPWRCLSKRQ